MRNWLYLLILMTALTACSLNAPSEQAADQATESANALPAEIQAVVGAPLPAGAGDVRYTSEAFFDVSTRVWLRFTLPPADVDGWLDTLGFENPLAPDVRQPFTDPQPEDAAINWWVELYEAGDFSSQGHLNFDTDTVYLLLADQANDDLWTIYMLVEQSHRDS